VPAAHASRRSLRSLLSMRLSLGQDSMKVGTSALMSVPQSLSRSRASASLDLLRRLLRTRFRRYRADHPGGDFGAVGVCPLVCLEWAHGPRFAGAAAAVMAASARQPTVWAGMSARCCSMPDDRPSRSLLRRRHGVPDRRHDRRDGRLFPGRRRGRAAARHRPVSTPCRRSSSCCSACR